MPRSPSRDRSDRFTGNRAYFREPDWLRRWKLWAVVCGSVVTALWVAVEVAHPQAAAFHTHGELANPHAAWDNNCAACHQSHGVENVSAGSVLNVRDRWHDLTCTKCHAGPAHHATAADSAFHDRCSNCHHDHNGRGHSLTQISDSHCTHCHANLGAAHVAGTSRYHNTITNFAADHPEFAVLRGYPPQGKDQPGRPYEPRRLKFSHALHMTPGLVYRPVPAERKGTAEDPSWTPARIERLHAKSDPDFGAAAAERYQSLNTADGITLSCAACHQLDAGHPDPDSPVSDSARRDFDRLTLALRGEPRKSVLPPRAAGAYYLPVNFDAHCKACHPVQAPAGTSGEALLDGFPLPHRSQPDELARLLKGGYAGRLAAKTPALAARPGPGGRLDPADPVVTTFGGEVDRLTSAALRTLLHGATPPGPPTDRVAATAGGSACGKCHYTTGPAAKPEDARIAPIPDRTVWFAHAKFNHVSHRGLTCLTCHPGTGRPDAPPGTFEETEPVSILGVKSCQACHAPKGTGVDFPTGERVSAAGIRHRCVDCHRYHNGDHPLQGLGAPARDPAAPQSLADFLRGGK